MKAQPVLNSVVRFVVLAVLVLPSAIVVGCTNPAPAPVAVVPTAAPQPVAQVAPSAVPPSATPIPPTNTVVPPTNTAAPPTNTPVPPTTTAAPPTNTAVPPTNTPVPPSPTPKGPQATVKGDTMNVRLGPGSNFGILTTAKNGQSFDVTGRNADGSWLQVCCFDGKKGWLSAGLVTTSGDASAIAVPADLPTPPPTPIPAPTSAAPAPAPVTGAGLSGVLLYSVVNWKENRWELWQYTFATGEAKFMKEWRTEAAFSPNYSQVAYFSWGPGTGNKPGIYAANADLSGERLVIQAGAAYPSFSPDGGRMVVQGGDKFYVMNSDGKGVRAIDVGEYPAWSPVDNWVAHRGCYGPDCGIWLTNIDSGERKRLTSGGSDGQPAWSPNGQQLAYISKDDGNFEIYRVNRDGSGKVRLTNDAHSDGLPVWSPGGDWIAFRSDRGGTWAIYVMRPDGSGQRKIVDADVLPAWFFEKMAWRP